MPVVKNLPANAGDTRDSGSIPGLWRSLGEGNGTPLQHSCLGNPTDGGTWWVTVRGVTKSQTQWSTHTRHLFVGIFLVVRLTFPLLVRLNLWGFERNVTRDKIAFSQHTIRVIHSGWCCSCSSGQSSYFSGISRQMSPSSPLLSIVYWLERSHYAQPFCFAPLF